MITSAVLNIVAKTPRGFSSFFSFFLFFSRYFYNNPPPLHFHWNSNLDTWKYVYFHCNNSIYTQYKKEELTYNSHPYLNLSQRGEQFAFL